MSVGFASSAGAAATHWLSVIEAIPASRQFGSFIRQGSKKLTSPVSAARLKATLAFDEGFPKAPAGPVSFIFRSGAGRRFALQCAPMKVLLVEDDLDLGNGIRIALGDAGLDVVWLRRLEDAVHALASQQCDLVLLDLGLPDGDGLMLLARLRRERRTLPVLILTARDALEDRLFGLDSGADDYLVKPFALAELLSRVRALARRSYGFDGDMLAVRGLCLHEPTRRVSVEGRPVELSRSEYALLAALLKRAGRVITRRVLEEQALPAGGSAGSNVLDVHMSNLRRKLGDGYIRTVRGVGYVIDQERA